MTDAYSSEILDICEPAMAALGAILARNMAASVTATPAALLDVEQVRGRLVDQGVGPVAALQEFCRDFLPATTAVASPRYWGLVNCTPWPLAIWSDLLVSALNNNAGATHQGYAGKVAEEECMAILAKQLGWHDGYDGTLVAGGSIANLQGALLMRQWAYPLWRSEGAPTDHLRACIYVSASSHFSLTRALRLAGFGQNSVRLVPMLSGGQMDSSALEAMIACDLQQGNRPLAIFATAGTTGVGAIDPLADLARFALQYGLWLHVDACYGSGGLFLPELAEHFAGIESADSVAIDPHKWMYMPVACAAFLTRHRQVLRDTFEPGDASYIPEDDEHGYLRSVHTSRRSQGLALWMCLRSVGLQGLRKAISRDIAHARLLEERLKSLGFDVLEGRCLSIACARARFPGLGAHALDAAQDQLALQMRSNGTCWFATTRHRGETWLRFNFVNLRTTVDDVFAVAEALHRARLDLMAKRLSSISDENSLRQIASP